MLLLPVFSWSNVIVRLSAFSSGRRVIMLDIGRDHHLVKADTGLLFFTGLSDDWKKTPVARITCVVVKQQKSFWKIEQIFDDRPLVLGQKLYLDAKSRINQGRVGKTVSSRTIWHGEKEISDWQREYLDGKNLSKRGTGYVEETAVETTPKEYFNADVEIPNFVQVSTERVLSNKDITQEKELFIEQLERETFEKTVAKHIQDINDPAFTPQLREKSMEKQSPDGMALFNKMDDVENRFDLFRAQKKNWIEYVDGDLKPVSVDTTGKREKNWIKYFDADWAVDMSYGVAINSNAPELSGSNLGSVSSNMNLQVGVELFPFKRDLSLRRVTFHSDARYQNNIIDVSSLSGENNLIDIGLGVHWHIFNLPGMIQRTIIAITSKMRFGQSNVSIPSLDSTESYSSVAFPTIGLLARYQFLTRFGFFFSYEYENMKLSVSGGDSNLPNDIAYRNSLAKIGVSYLF